MKVNTLKVSKETALTLLNALRSYVPPFCASPEVQALTAQLIKIVSN